MSSLRLQLTIRGCRPDCLLGLSFAYLRLHTSFTSVSTYTLGKNLTACHVSSRVFCCTCDHLLESAGNHEGQS